TDCIGTSVRHGCTSLVNFELLPKPPDERAADNPWPTWPRIFRTDYGHSEVEAKFGEDPRTYSILTKEFVANERGEVCGLKTVQSEWKKVDGQFKMIELPGTEKNWKCDLVLLAMGFLGPEHYVSEVLGIELDPRTNYKAPFGKYTTNHPKIFAAGD